MKKPKEEPEVDPLVTIEEDALDAEWLRQPKLFYKYALKLADAKLAVLQAKAALDVETADLSRAIHENPGEYGVTKVTGATVESAVLLQDSYQEAVKKYNEAKHAVDVMQAAVDALDHRKKALENLVFLHGQNYFSSPKQIFGNAPKKKR